METFWSVAWGCVHTYSGAFMVRHILKKHRYCPRWVTFSYLLPLTFLLSSKSLLQLWIWGDPTLLSHSVTLNIWEQWEEEQKGMWEHSKDTAISVPMSELHCWCNLRVCMCKIHLKLWVQVNKPLFLFVYGLSQFHYDENLGTSLRTRACTCPSSKHMSLTSWFLIEKQISVAKGTLSRCCLRSNLRRKGLWCRVNKPTRTPLPALYKNCLIILKTNSIKANVPDTLACHELVKVTCLCNYIHSALHFLKPPSPSPLQ